MMLVSNEVTFFIRLKKYTQAFIMKHFVISIVTIVRVFLWEVVCKL